jgi:disulfide bond formation protein DsbB
MIWPVRSWVSQYVVNALEEASKHQAGTSILLALPCMVVVIFVAVTFVLLFIVLRALQGMGR